MVDRNTPMVRVPPRCTRDFFVKALVLSPAAAEAGAMYDVAVANLVDPLFLLAVFRHESEFGTTGICAKYNTRSPGNTRSSRIGWQGFITDPEQGRYMAYTTWRRGAEDACYRLIDPSFDYARAGADRLAEIIYIWAPSSDKNKPEVYIASVIQSMNAWLAQAAGEGGTTNNMKIAISAGHHNSDGGSPLEYSITGELCEAYYRAFKAAGVDVRVITPDGPDADSDPGDGMFPGGLQDVAQKVVDWSNAGWTADLFLECHTQGLADTSVRGCFAIYPDWGGDLDQTVKDELGKKIVAAISAATGIPIYGNGLMSEKSTGVGISGYRLGIFLRTALVASKTTRLIVEHGAHSNPQDLAILQTPGMLDKIGAAGAKVIIEHFGGGTATVEQMKGDFSADQVSFQDPVTKFFVLGDFARYYQANGGLEFFGRPISSMTGGDKRFPEAQYVQWFERARFEWHPEEGAIMLGLVGREAMQQAA